MRYKELRGWETGILILYSFAFYVRDDPESVTVSHQGQ